LNQKMRQAGNLEVCEERCALSADRFGACFERIKLLIHGPNANKCYTHSADGQALAGIAS
jgi:hypothetical protein